MTVRQLEFNIKKEYQNVRQLESLIKEILRQFYIQVIAEIKKNQNLKKKDLDKLYQGEYMYNFYLFVS